VFVGAQGAQDLARGVEALELEGGRRVDGNALAHHHQVFRHLLLEVGDVGEDEKGARHRHRHGARGHGDEHQLALDGEPPEPAHFSTRAIRKRLASKSLPSVARGRQVDQDVRLLVRLDADADGHAPVDELGTPVAEVMAKVLLIFRSI
jgi:hypothetical protein